MPTAHGSYKDIIKENNMHRSTPGPVHHPLDWDRFTGIGIVIEISNGQVLECFRCGKTSGYQGPVYLIVDESIC
jgi:hypothetical protein